MIAVLLPWGLLLVFASNPVEIVLVVGMLYALYRLREPVWARTEARGPPPPWGAVLSSPGTPGTSG